MIQLTETVLGFYYDSVEVLFPHDCPIAKHPAFPLIILWRFTESNSFHNLPVNASISYEVINEESPIPNLTLEEQAFLNMFEGSIQLKWYRCKWVS
jgi:hypothetical protein